MYACEGWTIKKAECWRTYAFELWYWRRLLRLLDYKETKPVHSKGNQSWIFIGRTDAEAEATILWLPDAKNWLIGRLWCWEGLKAEEEGDEMVGWHQWPDGHEFEQAPGVGDGKGSLVCCHSRGCKESDMTEWLNWTEQNPRFRAEYGHWLQRF